MGIPKFYGEWLRARAFKSLEKYLPRNVSSLSIDLNGTFHNAYKKVFPENPTNERLKYIKSLKEDEIYLELFNEIGNILLSVAEKIHPMDYLILAVDGVPPIAKLKQQRERRWRSTLHKSQFVALDRNNITSGTNFMFKLDEWLQDFLENNKEKLCKKIIYSSHMVPGEGEHKIMDYYRSDILDKSKNHILYGLDADLIILSLVSPMNNIFLVRENFREILSIEKLKPLFESKDLEKKYDLEEIVFYTFTLGNDFLPFSPSMLAISESMDSLMLHHQKESDIIYKDDNGFLSINWQNTLPLFEHLSKREMEVFNLNQEMYLEFRENYYAKQYNFKSSGSFQSKIFNFLGENTIEKKMNKNVFNLEQMIISYLRTFSWIFRYYTAGQKHVNNEWFYGYKYAPLFSDIADFLKSYKPIHYISGFENIPEMRDFNILHQLLLVIPPHSFNVLPSILNKFTTVDSPIKDFHFENILTNSENLRVDHEIMVHIPNMEIKRVFDLITTLKLSENELKMIAHASDLTYISDNKKMFQYTEEDINKFQPYLKYIIDLIYKTYRITEKEKINFPFKIVKLFKSFGNNRRDMSVYYNLNKILERYNKIKTESYEKRNESNTSTVENILKDIKVKKPTTFLDIGSGDAEISKSIISKFDIENNNAFILDPKSPESEKYTLTTYEDEGMTKINLPSESIELITTFNLLHHVDPKKHIDLMSEIYRVLKPRGILIIKEHNSPSGDDNFLMFLKILHSYYYVINSESVDNLYSFNKNYFQRKFKIIGFNLVADIEVKSIKKIFFQAYQK